MKRKHESRSGFGKLLDAWEAPDEAGEPIGCVATSFTFSPAFFEEECLGRFLGLQTDAKEDGPAYLIEREEKLAQLTCASALVDQHHARGIRSLRWDLLSARLPRGILHAKVSLLLWTQRARLIVASANLTEDGYRRNHEVFAALDYFPDSDAPLPVLDDVSALLRESSQLAIKGDAGENRPLARWNDFLVRVRSVTRDWGKMSLPRGSGQPHVFAVLSGPDRPSVYETLTTRRSGTGVIELACVVSPFFDPPEAENRPAKELWTILKQKGPTDVEYHVTAEEIPDENAILVHAPESLLSAQPTNRSNITTTLKRLSLEDTRPLHAKSLWLQSNDSVLYLIGSSNFTSTGLGLGTAKNVEANLCFETNRSRQEEATKALEDAWLSTTNLPDDVDVRFTPRGDQDDDVDMTGDPVLPEAFAEIVFSRDEAQRGWLRFTFRLGLPDQWVLFAEDDQQQFATEAEWNAAESPAVWQVAWERDRPPSSFRVSWQGADGYAWWPVNVDSSAALPPPSELRDLPLEVLIEIRTSAKPLHQVVAAWKKREAARKSPGTSADLDPHKRVDTSGFLLQRTRRVSAALNALRERLQRPVASEQVLQWRLRGPVGVHALAEAISRAAKSPIERGFLLAELCLELRRVIPQEMPGSLAATTIVAAIRELMDELRHLAIANLPDPIAQGTDSIPIHEVSSVTALRQYVQTVFEEVFV